MYYTEQALFTCVSFKTTFPIIYWYCVDRIGLQLGPRQNGTICIRSQTVQWNVRYMSCVQSRQISVLPNITDLPSGFIRAGPTYAEYSTVQYQALSQLTQL